MRGTDRMRQATEDGNRSREVDDLKGRVSAGSGVEREVSRGTSRAADGLAIASRAARSTSTFASRRFLSPVGQGVLRSRGFADLSDLQSLVLL
jgi:hypothetical protein